MNILQNATKRLLQILLKSLTVVIALVSFSVGSVAAYTSSSLLVNGYGNIGSATFYIPATDVYKARTYTSSSIYFQMANSRHWHGTLEHEDIESVYNGTQTAETSYSSATYGAHSTQHTFYGAPGAGFNYYYLTPSGNSSYNVWNTGQP